MSRPRNPENAWLPKGVYFRKRDKRYLCYDESGNEVFLASEKATRHEVYRAHEKWLGRGKDTVDALKEAYTKSPEFKRLTRSTQKQYERHLDHFCNWIMPTRRERFGTLKITQVGNKTIQEAFDKQYVDGSKNTTRNRRFTIAKAMFSWGKWRFPGCEENPVAGLRMAPEHHRERYVEDWELDIAKNHASPVLCRIMEACYLFRLRPFETWTILRRRPPGVPLSKLKVSTILDDSILVFRGKGSWGANIEWSDRSRAWYREAKTHSDRFSTPYLLCMEDGTTITKPAYDSMVRAMWESIANSKLTMKPERFHIHDLKAKGKTDHDLKQSGHKSDRMGEVYDREHRRETPTR